MEGCCGVLLWNLVECCGVLWTVAIRRTTSKTILFTRNTRVPLQAGGRQAPRLIAHDISLITPRDPAFSLRENEVRGKVTGPAIVSLRSALLNETVTTSSYSGEYLCKSLGAAPSQKERERSQSASPPVTWPARAPRPQGQCLRLLGYCQWSALGSHLADSQ